jgi:hypothetical protein
MKPKFDDNQVRRLKLLADSNNNQLIFLGYVADLASGQILDALNNNPCLNKTELKILQTLLLHYSTAMSVKRIGKLVRFSDLPGGSSYANTFLRRAVQPIAKTFGNEPAKLLETAKRFNGFSLSYGDCSVEILALPRIPVTIILWEAKEFPASATILYDKSAINYLPTEDLAVIGELTTALLVEASTKTFG